MNRKKIIWYGISSLILAFLIVTADVSKFLQALTDVRLDYMTLSVLSGLSVFLVWATVWHMFFQKMDIRTKFRKSLKIQLAGNFMNSITPLGQFGGEPFMAYIISKNTNASYEKSLSAVISADIVNFLPVVTFIASGSAYAFFLGSTSNITTKIIYLTIIIILITGVIAYTLWFKEKALQKYLFKVLNTIERITKREKIIESLKKSIIEIEESFSEVGKDPGLLIKTVSIAHLIFVLQMSSLYFVLLAKGVEPSLMAIYFTLIISSLAIWSPTPGGTGTYEAAFSGMLMLFYPFSLDTALAIAILYRISTYWSGILIGYLAMLSLNTVGGPK